MEIDPVTEWRRLTEHYRQMYDAELQQLARDFADLTETAQQVLRDELRHRGLPQPGSTTPTPAAARQAQITFTPPESAPDEYENSEDTGEDASEPHEYTWKTTLCECEDRYQVWQLGEMLRRAGIESWSQSRGLLYPRILVAADQLEEARAVIAKPVPQDVIDESHEPPPADYEMPRCPNCRAEDPMLEDTEPVNIWLCEACGRQWSEPGSDLRSDTGPASGARAPKPGS